MKRYCVVGQKLPHTLSPRIHARYFELCGLQGEYTVCEIADGDFDRAKERLAAYDGFNVTVPYKTRVMALVDDLSDEARHIGAVNTVVNKDGIFCGYNTDPFGFGDMLARAQIDARGKDCVILGSGGASKALAHYLDGVGARVKIASRNPVGAQIGYADLVGMRGYLVINATPSGMFPDVDGCPIEEEAMRGFDCAADIVYNPTYTRFLQTAIKLGKVAAGGLGMLTAQAVKSQSIWQNVAYDASACDTIYRELKRSFLREEGGNYWLTGMAACGKSTLGRAFAHKSGRQFVDLDEYIVERSGQSVEELFARGEEVFRAWERRAVYEISLRKNLVVATGGGAPISPVNAAAMQLSGTVCLIDRSPQAIAACADACKGRPLLKDGAKRIYALYAERKETYFATADCVIDNNGALDGALETLLDLEKKG